MSAAANLRLPPLRFAGKDCSRFIDDGIISDTSEQQIAVEDSVAEIYKQFRQHSNGDARDNVPLLNRQAHASFLKKGLTVLSDGYECLDASRPWICYWILHSLDLLSESISPTLSSNIVQFLVKCQHPDGGFSGGPGQIAHLAPTYAAVNALCILGTHEAYEAIDRRSLFAFLKRLKTVEGSYMMHDLGEVDIRGVYCAAAVARLTNIWTDELFDHCAEWVVGCQTYEGGFAGIPGMEAHGGYTFCGLAALVLMGKDRLADVKSLLRWCVNRQMRFEGGFQGRTNKLVDGCYSFWQGGIFPLLHRILVRDDFNTVDVQKWLFHQGALQEYLLVCCQSQSGGLVDKPGKVRDFYHTCYGLSGLSVAQHFASGTIGHTMIIGTPNNKLMPTHPVYNIGVDAVANACEYFKNIKTPK